MAIGVSRGSRCRSIAAVLTLDSVSAIVSPSNSRRPVNNSQTTTPNAQMSVRLSTGFPDACSGLMYGRRAHDGAAASHSRWRGGFLLRPGRSVSDSCSMAARPKSSTFTVPSGVVMILVGFRSRCTIPFSCAASSAAAI